MKYILFFGDSLTAGYGLRDASTESLPALIQQKLDQTASSYTVINTGVSGNTSSDGKFRIGKVLHRQIDVFVLALGANDLLRGISPEITYTNLKAIIAAVKQQHPHVKILLLGMELPSWVPNKRLADFSSIFRRLALDHELAFVPFMLAGVAGMSHLNLPDGVHPLAAGYEIVATNVWPVLQQLL